MAETSLLWDGDSVGDAGPYDQDSFSKIFSMVMSSSLSTEGVLVGKQSELVVSNPSGLTIRVASGNAIVDGTMYDNTANVDLSTSAPVSGYYYYTVMLKKSFVTQTIRITLSSPSAVSYPALVQTAGVTWEISLAQVRVSAAGLVTVTDARIFCKFASLVTPANLNSEAFPYTTNGDQAYQSGSDILSRLALGGAGAIQKSNGVSPDWEALGTALQFLRVNAGATDIEWASMFTTLGELLVGGAAGASAILSPGDNGQALGLASGTPAWGNFNGIQSVQSMANTNFSDPETDLPGMTLDVTLTSDTQKILVMYHSHLSCTTSCLASATIKTYYDATVGKAFYIERNWIGSSMIPASFIALLEPGAAGTYTVKLTGVAYTATFYTVWRTMAVAVIGD